MAALSSATRPVSRFVRIRPDLQLHVLEHVPAAAERPAVSEPRPTFVLLHGLASVAQLWSGVASALATQGWHVLSVDQRGHGRSDKPAGPYDMEAVTDDLALLLDVEQLQRPVVAGQSWGANVVVEFAARFPGRARGIVAVDGGFIDLATSFPRWDDCEKEMAPPRWAGTPRAQFEGWMRSAHPTWPQSGIDGSIAVADLRDDDTVAPWLSFENHIQVLRGLWEHHPRERYASIVDPVWWMVADSGGADWATRKRTDLQYALDNLLKSRSTWFENSDHDLHAQHPQRVAEMLMSGVTEGFFA
jgi:pimeloyl-ACP methyl ester carboxylesterase